ncbi:flagellar biosynthetic protein FliR [Limnohabitans sp. Rim8]|uniref:flagellar biosynthetic protein FliR n=1 Tax=Limnohabitans sp. Rim8 TaxID=1100718 RepID=UPI003306024E
MNIEATEIVARFYALLWPMMRISALLLAAPIFSLRALTLRIRILFALALTWMVYPLHDWPTIDPLSPAGLLEIFNQLSIGLIMGLMLQVVTSAILLAGQAISNSVGLSMATMIDPNMGNVPVIGQFLIVMSTLIFVGLGGHAMLLALVLDSFNSMPIGQSLMGPAAWGQFVTWSSMIFLGGLLTALPVMVTLLFINVGLGVATRAAPSLNIFSLGFPAMVVAGFLVMILSLPSIGGRIQWLWLQGLMQTRGLVGLP